MKKVNRYEEANLFLLRLWVLPLSNQSGEADPKSDLIVDGENEHTAGCHGTLRRISEAKVYRFSSLQGLMDLLRAVVGDTNGGKGDEETY